MHYYKHNIIFFLALLFVGVSRLSAQDPTLTKGAVVVYPSFEGNTITIWPKDSISSDALLKNTSYFKISRSELQLNNKWSTFKKIGQTKRSKTVAELRSIVAPEGIGTLQLLKNFKTEQQVQHYLDTEYHLDSLLILTLFSPKFSEAFGISFTDIQAQKGVVYTYRVMRVDNSGKEELWAEPKIVSKVPNPLLNQIKIKQDTITTTDSLVLFNVHVEFPKVMQGKNDTFPQYSPINTRLSASEQKKAVIEQNEAFIWHLNALPIDPLFVSYKIYYQENHKGWKFFKKSVSTQDSVGIHRLIAFIKTTPESFIQLRVIPELLGGETAHPDSSEVFEAYAISQATVPLIYRVSGRDSIDCIKINWQIPSKPYCQGVIIERRQEDEPLEYLLTTNIQDTTYTDYNIMPGKIYTYHVRALFTQKNVEQKLPATIALSCKKFSPPLPPYSLQIDSTSQKLPILKWKAHESKSRFGFIVYRGTKPNQLSHLGEIVKGNTFTDSSGVFSAKVKMYYAVVEQNLTQDTSDFSNVVEFIPKMPLDITPPPFINSKLIDGDVFLDWPEMREKDDFISSYYLERRSELDTLFRPVTLKAIPTNFFIDTTYKRGYFHEYRIASVADNGQLGPYSMAFEVDFPMPRPSGVSAFSLRNTTKGVLVKWPSVALSTTKEYIVYRNDPPKAQLRKLATVPAGSFEYVDTAVSDTDSYLYAMSIVAKDGVESQRSPRKSLKRAKPNKLPTTPNAK